MSFDKFIYQCQNTQSRYRTFLLLLCPFQEVPASPAQTTTDVLSVPIDSIPVDIIIFFHPVFSHLLRPSFNDKEINQSYVRDSNRLTYLFGFFLFIRNYWMLASFPSSCVSFMGSYYNIMFELISIQLQIGFTK